MFCTKCQNDLQDCTCPDLLERLRSLQRPGTNVYIPNCETCGKPVSICKCKGHSKGERER